MTPDASPGGQQHVRSAGGRLWQMLPVDWGRVADVTNEPVPGHIKRWWFALGGTPAYLFLIQVTTGILLSFYYVPSPDHAYDSVHRISETIPFGWFLRSIHKWASHLMIITVILHMCRVYFSCAFRHPRQLNWVIGCGLLVCTLTMGFTGYSLVYEQLSYWGMTVATELMAAIPFIGGMIATFMRGGETISPNTLTRMYNLHVGLLPIAMIVLIGFHISMLRLHGVSELSFRDAGADAGRPAAKPAHRLLGVRIMALVAALAALGCGILAVLNFAPVRVIAYELTLESSRIFWMVLGSLSAASAVLLARGHMYGLMIWLTLCIPALGKLVFDLAEGEAIHRTGWIIIAVILTVTVVYGLIRHHRFIEVTEPDKPFSFFPDHLITELMIGTLLLFLLTLLSLVFPAQLGERANPLVTPEHIKPEWYYFFQFRLLKLTGLNTAVLLTGFILGVIVLWPWIDMLLERLAPGRDIGVYIGIVGFTLYLALTVWEAMI